MPALQLQSSMTVLSVLLELVIIVTVQFGVYLKWQSRNTLVSIDNAMIESSSAHMYMHSHRESL